MIQDDGRATDTDSDYHDERTNRHVLAEPEGRAMIVKAVFFLAVVALFMPHEPNLGFGTPGSQAPSNSTVTNIECKALAVAGAPCSVIAEKTTATPDSFDQARETFLVRLQAVKADLRASSHVNKI